MVENAVLRTRNAEKCSIVCVCVREFNNALTCEQAVHGVYRKVEKDSSLPLLSGDNYIHTYRDMSMYVLKVQTCV